MSNNLITYQILRLISYTNRRFRFDTKYSDCSNKQEFNVLFLKDFTDQKMVNVNSKHAEDGQFSILQHISVSTSFHWFRSIIFCTLCTFGTQLSTSPNDIHEEAHTICRSRSRQNIHEAEEIASLTSWCPRDQLPCYCPMRCFILRSRAQRQYIFYYCIF